MPKPKTGRKTAPLSISAPVRLIRYIRRAISLGKTVSSETLELIYAGIKTRDGMTAAIKVMPRKK